MLLFKSIEKVAHSATDAIKSKWLEGLTGLLLLCAEHFCLITERIDCRASSNAHKGTEGEKTKE